MITSTFSSILFTTVSCLWFFLLCPSVRLVELLVYFLIYMYLSSPHSTSLNITSFICSSLVIILCFLILSYGLLWVNHIYLDITQYSCINQFLNNRGLQCLLCSARVCQYIVLKFPVDAGCICQLFPQLCIFKLIFMCFFFSLHLLFCQSLISSHWQPTYTSFQLRWWHLQLPDSSSCRCQCIEALLVQWLKSCPLVFQVAHVLV